MRTLSRVLLTSLLFASFAAQAGTINAGFYFSKDCLSKIAYKTFPKKLTFSCTPEGKCFTNDMLINDMLRCATPFGNEMIKTESVKTFVLSPKSGK